MSDIDVCFRVEAKHQKQEDQSISLRTLLSNREHDKLAATTKPKWFEFADKT
jgi:hypothetical protein